MARAIASARTISKRTMGEDEYFFLCWRSIYFILLPPSSSVVLLLADNNDEV